MILLVCEWQPISSRCPPPFIRLPKRRVKLIKVMRDLQLRSTRTHITLTYLRVQFSTTLTTISSSSNTTNRISSKKKG